MAESFAFTEQAARRIVRVVRDMERRLRADRPQNQVPLLQQQLPIMLAKTDAAITKGSTGDVSAYAGDAGAEGEVTDLTIEVYNRFGDVDADVWVLIAFVDNTWELLVAECADDIIRSMTSSSLASRSTSVTSIAVYDSSDVETYQVNSSDYQSHITDQIVTSGYEIVVDGQFNVVSH